MNTIIIELNRKRVAPVPKNVWTLFNLMMSLFMLKHMWFLNNWGWVKIFAIMIVTLLRCRF